MRIRAFTYDDIERMRMWLEQDYIRKFWGEPQVWIDEISENLQAEWIKYFIVENGDSIGFLQYYETDKAPQGIWSDEPIGTVGIDYLIGDKEYVGKGYGSAIIGLLVDLIRSLNKYDYIIADPVEANILSIKALERNGFIKMGNGLYRLNLP